MKCLRPDLLVNGLDRFARNIVDIEYFDFQADIADPIFNRNKKKSGYSAIQAAQKILG
jgi:hypothetical protein